MSDNKSRPLLWLLPLIFVYLLVAQMGGDRDPVVEPELTIPDGPEDPSDPESIRRWLELKGHQAAAVVTKDKPPEIPPPVLNDHEKDILKWATSPKMIGKRFNGDARDPHNLVLLRIEDPTFEDTLQLKEFKNLAYLDLLFPKFDQRGWRNLAESTKLARLLIYKNQVPPPADALTRFEIDTILIFRNTKFETDLLLDPQKMSTLKWLEVSNTQLTTDQVKVIAEIKTLEIIDFHNTQVDSGIFDLIKNHSKLRILRLNGCPVDQDQLDDWIKNHEGVVVNGPRPERLDGRTR